MIPVSLCVLTRLLRYEKLFQFPVRFLQIVVPKENPGPHVLPVIEMWNLFVRLEYNSISFFVPPQYF